MRVTLQSQKLIVFPLFEVPILAPRMRISIVFLFFGCFSIKFVFAKDNKHTRQRSQLGVPVCGTFIVFLLSVLAKDNKLVRQRSQFSVPVCGTFTVFLLFDILQTYSVFAKDKKLRQQTCADCRCSRRGVERGLDCATSPARPRSAGSPCTP